MSIFLLSFYPDGNLNKIDNKIKNNKTKIINSNNNNNNKTKKINNNYKNNNKYEELKKELEINPFF